VCPSITSHTGAALSDLARMGWAAATLPGHGPLLPATHSPPLTAVQHHHPAFRNGQPAAGGPNTPAFTAPVPCDGQGLLVNRAPRARQRRPPPLGSEEPLHMHPHFPLQIKGFRLATKGAWKPRSKHSKAGDASNHERHPSRRRCRYGHVCTIC